MIYSVPGLLQKLRERAGYSMGTTDTSSTSDTVTNSTTNSTVFFLIANMELLPGDGT